MSGHLGVMVRLTKQGVLFAPLGKYHISLLLTRTARDSERLNTCPDMLASIADKLRYYRYKKGLLQQEVADYADLDRATYVEYERGRDSYPVDKLAKIAELLGVEPMALMDDYHAFLFNGQGKQLKILREKLKLTQKELAEHIGVAPGTVKRWESESIRMTQEAYMKAFESSFQDIKLSNMKQFRAPITNL